MPKYRKGCEVPSTVAGEILVCCSIFCFILLFYFLKQSYFIFTTYTNKIANGRNCTLYVDYMNMMEKISFYKMAFNTLPITSVCDYTLELSPEPMTTNVSGYHLWNTFHVSGILLSPFHAVIYVFIIPTLGSFNCWDSFARNRILLSKLNVFKPLCNLAQI